MIHELIGLENNLVDMSKFKSETKKELTVYSLAPSKLSPFLFLSLASSAIIYGLIFL